MAVMFQIVSALVLYVPEASTCLDQSQGVPPNVLLSSEPWGHINHDGSACLCLLSDRTGLHASTVCWSASLEHGLLSVIAATGNDNWGGLRVHRKDYG